MNPHRQNEDPMNDDTEENTIEVLGIDDCDHLFSCTSRDGLTTYYLRTQEDPKGKGFLVEVTFDCDKCHDCFDIETGLHFATLAEIADYCVDYAREQIGCFKYSLCSDTKKLRTS